MANLWSWAGDLTVGGTFSTGTAAITTLSGNPNFSGSPTLTTSPTTGDNSTAIATTAFVKSQSYAPLASPTFTGTATIANAHITGTLADGTGSVGTSGQVLSSTVTGTLWVTSSATPGGVNTDVQYNNSGAFGGDARFTFDPTFGSFTAHAATGTSAQQLIGNGNNQLFIQDTQVNVNATETGSQLVFLSDGDITLDPATGGTGKVKTGGSGRPSGSIVYFGLTSGSAELGCADVAGTPNRINLPITTGTAGQFLETDGGTPQQTSWQSFSNSPATQTVRNGPHSIASATLGGPYTINFTTPFADGNYTVNVTAVIGETSSYGAVTSIIAIASVQQQGTPGNGVIVSVSNADSITHTVTINVTAIHD